MAASISATKVVPSEKTKLQDRINWLYPTLVIAAFFTFSAFSLRLHAAIATTFIFFFLYRMVQVHFTITDEDEYYLILEKTNSLHVPDWF